MKLPDFLEELNQGAEKAFGENAKSMIDSLLCAKLPPKLKRSVNMTRLEIGTYEEIVAHLERELELNALEESDDLPMAIMASASTNQATTDLFRFSNRKKRVAAKKDSQRILDRMFHCLESLKNRIFFEERKEW